MCSDNFGVIRVIRMVWVEACGALMRKFSSGHKTHSKEALPDLDPSSASGISNYFCRYYNRSHLKERLIWARGLRDFSPSQQVGVAKQLFPGGGGVRGKTAGRENRPS